MAGSYAKIEDIVEQLSADLGQRRFSRVYSEKDGLVRYAKQQSPIDFQIGIRQDDANAEEPELNLVYLSLGYDMPAGASTEDGERMVPNPKLMHIFFRNSPVSYQTSLYNCQSQKGRMDQCYKLAFKKDRTTDVEMRAVLREAVDYLCDYITTNVRMLTLTQRFDE